MYRYLRLLRVMDTDRRSIEADLIKLAEFIKYRSGRSRELSYYTLTFVRKGSIDGFIVIESDNEEELVKEVELIRGFIESNLNTIKASIVKHSGDYLNVPLPKAGNF